MNEKNKPQIIEKSDMIDYLETSSDFSFELKVLKMLRDNKLECEHSGHYKDPVTNLSREFDIRAKMEHGNYCIRLAVECKNIKDTSPILVTIVPRSQSESFHTVALVKTSKYVPSSVLNRMNIRFITANDTFYRSKEFVGKNLTQLKKSNNVVSGDDRDLYKKWSQCLSSLNDLVVNSRLIQRANSGEDDVLSLLALPILVVPDNSLWAVNYDEDGNCLNTPSNIDHVPIYIAKDYLVPDGVMGSWRYIVSHLEVMTFKGLRNFVQQYLLDENSLKNLIGPHDRDFEVKQDY